MIDKNDPAPIYLQVRDAMKRKVASGEWKENQKLPAESDLAEEWGISRGTMRQAIKKLIEEKILIQIQGKGTYVVGVPMEQPLAERLISVAEAMSGAGIEFATRLLDSGVTLAGGNAGPLEIESTDEVYRLKRLRLTGEQPAVYLVNYLPKRLYPGLLEVDFEKETLFSVISQKYGYDIDWGKRGFVAKAADKELSALLEIPTGTPLTFLEQTIYSPDNRPLEYSQVWIRNDIIKLTSTMKRNDSAK